MNKTKSIPVKVSAVWLLAITMLVLFTIQPGYAAKPAQKTLPAADSATAPHRTRLYLKDGSYQMVMSYRIAGSVVHYISAERDGAEDVVTRFTVEVAIVLRQRNKLGRAMKSVENKNAVLLR